MSWQQSEAPKQELWEQEQAAKNMNDQPVSKIAGALVRAQKAFGPALKTATNPHFKKKYADLSACVEAVIDGLNENGIMLIQKTHNCESGVTVETIFLHESGEQYSAGVLHVPAAKQDPQGYGSALTYCRRYSLMAACGIAPEDDDGNAATASKAPAKPRNPPPPPRAVPPATVTMAQIQDLMNAMKVAGVEESAMLARAKIKQLRELEAGKFKGAMDWIKSQAGNE